VSGWLAGVAKKKKDKAAAARKKENRKKRLFKNPCRRDLEHLE